MIKTGKNESIIWEYLTGSELDAEKLSKPQKVSELGLSKTDWIGAAYFLLGKDDPRKKIEKKIEIPIFEMTVYSNYPNIKTAEDAFVFFLSQAQKSIKMVSGELEELANPFFTYSLEDALERGVDVQIISGPAFYIGRSVDHSEIYGKPIKLKDGLSLSFSGGSVATIGTESFLGEESTRTDKERATLLSYIAEKNNKPILFQIASQACRDAMKKEGESYDLLRLLGYNQYKNTDFYGAVETFEKAKRVSIGTSEQAEACSNLGFIHSKVGRYGEGILELEEGIGLNEEQIYAHNNLATIFHLLAASKGKQKYFTESKSHYEKELEITPDHPTAERMLGQINRLEELICA